MKPGSEMWRKRLEIAWRGENLKPALKAMVVVGLLLNIVHVIGLPLWFKLIVTPVVPFLVALYGTVEAQLKSASAFSSRDI